MEKTSAGRYKCPDDEDSILDMANKIYIHQNSLKHALVSNDLASFLSELNSSQVCLLMLTKMLNKHFENLKKEKGELGGER